VSARLRTVEVVRAAFWAARTDRHRPSSRIRPGYMVAEASRGEAGELARAMGVIEDVPRGRFQRGARAWVAYSPDGTVAAWVWVSTGRERAVPIRRELRFAADEAYGWDAGTLPGHRGLGLFTVLLEQSGNTMRCEGRTVMWGGIHDHNLASRRASVHAGFSPVLRFSALLLGPTSLIRARAADYADPDLVRRAHRVLGSAPESAVDPRQPAGEVASAAAPAQRRNPQ